MGVRLSDDEAWDVLAQAHTGILTTLRRDGWPVSLPIWFVVDERRVYVGTPERSKKVTRIRNDDRGCLLVESGEAWVDLAAVELAVRATVVDDPEEIERASALIGAKYDAFRPAATRLPDATTKHYSGQAIVRLDPAGKLLTWDNSRLRLNPTSEDPEARS